MNALVHVVYVTSTLHGQPLDDFNVLLEISPQLSQNETIVIPIKDLDLSSNKSSWNFDVQQYNTQFLSISILDSSKNLLPIANINIPISSFSVGHTTKGEFKLNPTAFGTITFSILIEVLLTNKKLLNLDSNISKPNIKNNYIGKSILQSVQQVSPNPPAVQPRLINSNNLSPKSRPYSLPISTFNTFQGNTSFTSQSENSDQNSYASSSSSVDSVELDLSESSDDQNYRPRDDDDSSSSYLSESSTSEKNSANQAQTTNQDQKEMTRNTSLNTQESSSNNSENSEKKRHHRHHHRHHHHHHKHHEHNHDDKVHHSRRSRHHQQHHRSRHSHSNDSLQQSQQQQIQRPIHRRPLVEENPTSQRLLRPHIRSIASDKNIHRKKAMINERKSSRILPLFKDIDKNDIESDENRSSIITRERPERLANNPFLQ